MDRQDKYRQCTDLNYSTLKSVGYNPKWIEWKRNNPEAEDEEKPHLRIGGALDALQTSPENFSKEFVTSMATRPSGYMGKFIETLSLNLDLSEDLQQYEDAYVKSGFKIPIAQVVKKFLSSTVYKEYYKARQEAQGRKVLSVEEYETVMFCRKELLSNTFTQKYFLPERNCELFYQIPIYFTYRGVKLKSMLDGILIDHNKQTIQPWDLKTMGKGTWTFPFEFINRSYYLQAALYQIAVRRLLSDENTRVDHPRLTANTIDLLKSYTLLDMQFVVVPKETTEGARIFQCTSDDISSSITGGKLKSGKEIEGLNNLLDRFIWHTNSGKWGFPMEVYENLGITNLNVYES